MKSKLAGNRALKHLQIPIVNASLHLSLCFSIISHLSLSRSPESAEMFSAQFEGAFTSSQSSQPTDASLVSSKIRDSPGLVPLTVKLISEAQPGSDKSNFVINGGDVTNVTVVGMVSNKSAQVTDVSFTLDDGTGQISCTRWTNEAYDMNEMEDVQDGMYVRVIGRLRSFQGKQQLTAFSVRPVTNFDEVTYHYTECIHYQLKNNKAKMQGDFKIPSSQSGDPIVSTPTQNGSNGSQTLDLSGQFRIDGRKGFDQMVLDYLQQPSIYELEKGVHRDELSKKMKIPMDKIMETVMTLEEEGLIYSTIDEFHFKATTSG